MEVKPYIEPHLEKGGVAIFVRLYVHGDFVSAWFPAILEILREAIRIRIVYYLIQDYLKERKGTIKSKFQHVKEHNNRVPTGIEH